MTLLVPDVADLVNPAPVGPVTMPGDVHPVALTPFPSSVRPWLSRLRSWLGLVLAAPVEGRGDEVDDLTLARARKGDHGAFTEIVRCYDDRLRALAFRLLDDRDRMDDVLQEAYVKAYRGLAQFKGAAALGTWLYRITYNACMDELRRTPRAALVEDDVDRPSLARGPGEIAVERSSLAAALRSLPADQRAAVLLVDADGLDYAAAAEVLGVRAGTVASRLSRARAVLRRALEETHGE
jgi:RNA polymerase sigma-70 factor (ECF subfamily)